MTRRRRVPSYRLHTPSKQAVVTLSGKDCYLGKHGSDESREEYDRLVGEWLANGRHLPTAPHEVPALTVGQLILRYWKYCEGRYGDGSGKLTPELYHHRRALRVVRKRYGRKAAIEFGPIALKACRRELVEDGLVRKSVMQHCWRIVRMFQWATEEELLPASVYRALKAVRALRRGEAEEGKKVRPVSQDHIDAALEHVSPTVRAMAQVQLWTGMRSGELCRLRGTEIDRSRKAWLYRPEDHKTAHLGYERPIFMGPQAQEVLRPLLELAGDGYVFSPRRSENARNARRKLQRRSKVTPSQAKRKRKANRKRPWKDHYEPESYCRAIVRACEKAGVPKWTPHRLRHTFATRMREERGLDVTQALLGHRSPDVTAIYAEVSYEKAAEAIMALG